MMLRFTRILSELSLARRGGLAAIRAYQAFLSPLMWSACRYYPTCSRYSYEAIEMYGLGRGMWLGLNRLLRCHPFTRRGGYDPVPGPVRSVFLSPDDPAKRDWGEESQPLSALRSPRARHPFVRRDKDGRSSAAEALL